MLKNITKLRAVTALVTAGAIATSGYFLQPGSSKPAPTARALPAQAALVPAPMPASGMEQVQKPLAEAQADAAPQMLATPDAGADIAVTRAPAQPVLAVAPAQSAPQAPAEEDLHLAASGAQPGEEATPAITPDPGAPEALASCDAGFTAFAAPGAMVDLTIEAPCRGGEMVDIFHEGLRFSIRLDKAGLAQVSVPALSEEAMFNALFTDGMALSADLLMLTTSDYDRTALDWKGETGFDLYALEDGAEWGSAGHVGAAHPYAPSRATAGEGGFFVSLGSVAKGYHALVYSWPARLADEGQSAEISIEAQVNTANCGHRIEGTILRANAGAQPESLPLTMEVPGCDAMGEYLVLKNLPQDRTLAAK